MFARNSLLSLSADVSSESIGTSFRSHNRWSLWCLLHSCHPKLSFRLWCCSGYVRCGRLLCCCACTSRNRSSKAPNYGSRRAKVNQNQWVASGSAECRCNIPLWSTRTCDVERHALHWYIPCRNNRSKATAFGTAGTWIGSLGSVQFCSSHIQCHGEHFANLGCAVSVPTRLWFGKIWWFDRSTGKWIGIHLARSCPDTAQSILEHIRTQLDSHSHLETQISS